MYFTVVRKKENKTYHYMSLSPKVIVVASVNEAVGDFSCYIDGVEGDSHEDEFMGVAARGSKLDKNLSEVLFPELFTKYTWRA
jgi:hypothetical protein